MGAQLSTRAVALLGTNFVCAHAGDEIRRIARISFFMDFSREIRAIWPLLNRMGQEKSNEDMAPGGSKMVATPADYLTALTRILRWI